MRRHLHLSCRDCGTYCASGSNGFLTLENDVSDEEKPNDGEGNETSCDSLIFSSSKEEKTQIYFIKYLQDTQ